MYKEFFNLNDQPFRLSPDHRFFFRSGAHNRALAHLKFGLDQKEGFILITGDVGAGKTTLVDHLLASLNPRHFVAANIVTTNLDQDNMIRMIASSFGLTQEGLNRTSVFRNIERFIADSARQGRRCLLFVDEAQNLSIAALEELRMLSNLQINGQPALQSFLLGQPQFRQTLARKDLAQLRQRVIASYHLGPLNLEETGAYIRHRLEVVGWAGDPVFEDEAVAKIFEIAGGIPRQINTLCNRLMLNACLEEHHTIGVPAVLQVSGEIAEELGQVLDFQDTNDAVSQAHVEAPDPQPVATAGRAIEAPESDEGPTEDVDEQDVPIPHVEKTVVLDLEVVDEALRAGGSLEEGIPDYNADQGAAEVIDLTIHASEDLSLEAERRLKKRALHTVINFLGGRG
jgi:putative secretion ATPase (PEP-CTERM system associated)